MADTGAAGFGVTAGAGVGGGVGAGAGVPVLGAGVLVFVFGAGVAGLGAGVLELWGSGALVLWGPGVGGAAWAIVAGVVSPRTSATLRAVVIRERDDGAKRRGSGMSALSRKPAFAVSADAHRPVVPRAFRARQAGQQPAA